MISIIKPFTFVSEGNFGPPIFYRIGKINDIKIVVTEKKKEFVYNLPQIFDPDNDKVDIILDFNQA